MITDDGASSTNRRAFLGTMAAGTLAMAGTPLAAEAAVNAAAPDEPWLTAMKGKHRQVFDVTNFSNGVGLAYASTYLSSMAEHYQLAASEVKVMVVLRYLATAMAVSDDVWKRYKLGAAWGLSDPATKAPAERNLFISSRPGDIANPSAAIDRLLAKGAVIAVCGHALRVLSGANAVNAGVPPAAALAEWTASLLPGFHVVPSGVLAVARAQEVGCTYCFGS